MKYYHDVEQRKSLINVSFKLEALFRNLVSVLFGN